jgi:beta-lactamase regulating signal transducer with metallopeptidase domain
MLLFEWLVRAAVLAALMGVGAWALEEVLRGANRSTRFVWLGALLFSIALPAASLLAPDLWPESLKRPGIVVAVPDATVSSSASIPDAGFAATTPSTPRWSARQIALFVWLSASLLLGLRWLHGWYRLRRARVYWKEAILAGERVLVSEDLGPAVVGLVRPRVVVPSWLFLGNADHQRMIVRHEVQHLRAGDQWLLAFAPVLVALFPWNPALWWQLRRLRIAIELDCDARVLRGGEKALEYGCMLLDVAGSTTVLQPTLAALSEPRTSLERRIRAMTPTRYRHALTRAASLTILCAVMIAGALVAIAPTARAVVAQAAPARAQQQEGNPLVVLDGKVMRGAKLNFGDLQLATVEVLKPEEAVRKFGAQARYGAVVISTRGPELAALPMEREELKVRRALEKAIADGEIAKLEKVKIERANIETQGELISGRGTIEGEVIRRETKEPVVNAQVIVGERGAITDRVGRFVIRGVPAGEHMVHVRAAGDATGVRPAVVTANAVTRLEPVVVDVLSEQERRAVEVERVAKVVTRAQAAEVEARAARVAEQIEKAAKPVSRAQAAEVEARSARAARVAQEIEKAAKAADPIIYVDGERLQAPAAVSVRTRGTTSQTSSPIIVIDGVVVGRLSGTDAGKILSATLGPENIERIEVFKGAAARQLYGDYAEDGVISITTKKRR